MLEVEGLSARAGDFCLRDVTLRVGEGECHAVLGPSGSGKTTLLHAVLGVLPLASGRIWLAGEDITHLPVERRHLGYVPQHLGLFPHLSVRDNILYAIRTRRLPEGEYRPILDRLVEITGIGPLLDRRTPTLSGGERQRVALVRALAANPRVVLLDEPFTALNESLRRELWWLVKDLQRERRLTVMLVTHDLMEAYFLADHVTLLLDGRKEQGGETRSVFRRPASLAAARFLGLRNLFPGTVTWCAEGHVLVECQGLGLHFRLPGEAAVGTPVAVGLRPEDVALRDADHPPRAGERVVRGTVRVVDLGPEAAIHLNPAGGGPVVELLAPWRTLRRFGIRDGQTDVAVAFPEEAMFWVAVPRGDSPAVLPGGALPAPLPGVEETVENGKARPDRG